MTSCKVGQYTTAPDDKSHVFVDHVWQRFSHAWSVFRNMDCISRRGSTRASSMSAWGMDVTVLHCGDELLPLLPITTATHNNIATQLGHCFPFHWCTYGVELCSLPQN